MKISTFQSLRHSATLQCSIAFEDTRKIFEAREYLDAPSCDLIELKYRQRIVIHEMTIDCQ